MEAIVAEKFPTLSDARDWHNCLYSFKCVPYHLADGKIIITALQLKLALGKVHVYWRLKMSNCKLKTQSSPLNSEPEI